MTEMPVERGKIREFALATANTDSDYLDLERAPIPPTFFATVVFWDQPGGGLRTPEAQAALGTHAGDTDMRSILSAEQEYVFYGPLPRAGDRLQLTHRFDGVEVKEGRRGGSLTFIKFATEFHDAEGQIRAECLYTTVRTSQAASDAANDE